MVVHNNNIQFPSQNSASGNNIVSVPLLDGDGLAAAAEIISCFFPPFPPARLGILLPFPTPLLFVSTYASFTSKGAARRRSADVDDVPKIARFHLLVSRISTVSFLYAIRRRGRETPQSSSALCPTSSIHRRAPFSLGKSQHFWRNRVFIHQSMIN